MVPALDDLADAELELERVAAVNAAVELGAVEEGAGVVDGDLGAGLGALVSRALHENLLHASAILELGDVRLLANLEVLVHHVLVVAHAGHVGAHVVHRSGSAERQDGGRGRDDRQSAIFRRLSNSFASRDPRRSPRAHSPTREREEGKKREGSTEGICSRTLVCVSGRFGSVLGGGAVRSVALWRCRRSTSKKLGADAKISRGLFGEF